MLNTFAAKGELRMRKWHRYTQEFKDQAVARLKGCTNVEALARELHVSRGILYLWRDKQEGEAAGVEAPRTDGGLANDRGIEEGSGRAQSCPGR
jgi:transposase-like protein